jgi:hypothetical protein
MSLGGKLERWQREGVIDAETAARIAAFEARQRRPIALYAMAVLGAGTVALGIVSIVAANWDAIPARVSRSRRWRSWVRSTNSAHRRTKRCWSGRSRRRRSC